MVRFANLVPKPKIQTVISFELRVVQIVVAGRDNMAPPPAFDPTLRVNFPACMIKDGIDCHQHKDK